MNWRVTHADAAGCLNSILSKLNEKQLKILQKTGQHPLNTWIMLWWWTDQQASCSEHEEVAQQEPQQGQQAHKKQEQYHLNNASQVEQAEQASLSDKGCQISLTTSQQNNHDATPTWDCHGHGLGIAKGADTTYGGETVRREGERTRHCM